MYVDAKIVRVYPLTCDFCKWLGIRPEMYRLRAFNGIPPTNVDLMRNHYALLTERMKMVAS